MLSPSVYKNDMCCNRDTKTFCVDLAIRGTGERNTTIAVNAKTIQKRLSCLSSLWAFCFFLSGFVIRSNLNKRLPQRSFVQHVSRRNNIRLRSSKKRTTNTTASCQLTEMRPDRQMSADISQRSLPVSVPGSTSNTKDPALAKGHVVEIFKACRQRQFSMMMTWVCCRLSSTSFR